MRDISELYDALDQLVESGEGIAPPADIARARTTLDLMRRRVGGLGSTLFVALAGGTGTGKSSLLNAIAAERIASVSRLRPHTDEPLAWVAEDASSSAGHLLTELGVTDLRTQARLPGLTLIDLPDMDSVEGHHRRTTERVIANVDAVIWVLDPEKYHDSTLHRDFLTPLARYADQTVFVLNKVDRIAGDDVANVLSSVRETLIDRGYFDPIVFPLAADPPSGSPAAVEPLVAFLGTQIDRKRTAHGKLLSDIAGLVQMVGESSGVWQGAAIGLDERWTATRESALAAIDADAGSPGEDALCRIEDLIAATAAEVGGLLAVELRGRFDTEEVDDIVRMAQVAVDAGDVAGARSRLDERIGAPMGVIVARRSRFAALVALTHIGARQLGRRYGATVR